MNGPEQIGNCPNCNGLVFRDHTHYCPTTTSAGHYYCKDCGVEINPHYPHVCADFRTGAKRDPSGLRYDVLDTEFEELMARIAHYGAEHYGDFNWQKSRLTGDKGPMNHVRKHYAAYQQGKPYDHPEVGEGKKVHLAAIAFNAMMEFWYCTQEEKKECQASTQSSSVEHSQSATKGAPNGPTE